MRNNIKTARGAILDMAALAAKNETTRAVGNVPINARGDRLNEDGTVKVKAEDIAVAHQNLKEPPQQQPISDPKPIEQEPITATTEKPKAKTAKAPPTIGSSMNFSRKSTCRNSCNPEKTARLTN